MGQLGLGFNSINIHMKYHKLECHLFNILKLIYQSLECIYQSYLIHFQLFNCYPILGVEMGW